MNARTKIFIAESDCASLVSLMLWLDQFPEFEVAGATADATHIFDQVKSAKPDMVLLDVSKSNNETIHLIRTLKGLEQRPAVLLRCQNESYLGDSALSLEADCSIGPKNSIKELCEAIRKVANKRKVALSAANMPMTKAG